MSLGLSLFKCILVFILLHFFHAIQPYSLPFFNNNKEQIRRPLLLTSDGIFLFELYYSTTIPQRGGKKWWIYTEKHRGTYI